MVPSADAYLGLAIPSVSFLGLSAGATAALLVPGAAVLAALHLLGRRRARRLVVPFAPLWTDGAEQRRLERFAPRLLRPLSLLLKLAVFALALLAAADPRAMPDAGAAARDIVILLDRSASMGARDEPSGRLARARDVARDVIARIRPADRGLLVSYAGTATAHTPFTSDRAWLTQALEQVAVSHEPDDLGAALAFGRALLTGAARPTLVVVSDRGATDAALSRALDGLRSRMNLMFLGVGRRRENTGIVAFSARRAPTDRGMAELALVMQSFASQRTVVTAEIRAATTGAVLARRELIIDPDARVPLALTVTAPPDGALTAELIPAVGQPRDDLAADDRAYAVLPQRATTRVLVVGPPNLYLDGALLSLGAPVTVTRADGAPTPDLRAAIAEHDVVIVDGAPPPDLPAHGRFLFIDPHGPHSPWPGRGRFANPVVTKTDREHPVTRHVSLADLNVTAARRLDLARGDVALASAETTPLLIARDRAGERGADGLRAVALAFDVRASDLPMRAAFPLLIGNALDWLAAPADPPPRSYATGASVRVDLRDRAALGNGSVVARVIAPDGRRSLVPIEAGTVTLVPDQPGFFTIETLEPDTGAASPTSFAPAAPVAMLAIGAPRVVAVNLASAAESDTRPAAAESDTPLLRATPDALGVPQRSARFFPWAWLALAAIAAALVEWLGFKRRLSI